MSARELAPTPVLVAGREPRWPATVVVVALSALYLLLPDRLSLGPTYLFPALALLLAVPLAIVAPTRHVEESRILRISGFALLGLVAVANLSSLAMLVRDLLGVHHAVDGRELLQAALIVWTCNLLVFGLWFWELDRGGPDQRSGGGATAPDFLFPQQGDPDLRAGGWRPTLADYLYVAFTNGTAFSPTDTMPVSLRAKALMAGHALASLVTIVLVTARAVNVLQ
ncbi:hypothetical protein [Patulibacter defluvii]|uniref:hypothetical protein n=1 Tax=Patulibacter defluvii TaxID=3095358 RepID=UPI002A764D60|nr:hypothetical protein [Patulibacter sp. DM4]